MDPLEQFIRDNRGELQYRPKDKDALWDKINHDIKPQKQVVIKKLNWQKWAAAASIVLAIGFGIFWMQHEVNSSDVQLADQRPVEVLEIDAHYQKLINARVMQVKNSNNLSEQQKTEIIDYLEKLELESRDLEKEFETNINNVQVIEAIINNYRTRLDVMEKLLDRTSIQKNKRHESNISI